MRQENPKACLYRGWASVCPMLAEEGEWRGRRELSFQVLSSETAPWTNVYNAAIKMIKPCFQRVHTDMLSPVR